MGCGPSFCNQPNVQATSKQPAPKIARQHGDASAAVRLRRILASAGVSQLLYAEWLLHAREKVVGQNPAPGKAADVYVGNCVPVGGGQRSAIHLPNHPGQGLGGRNTNLWTPRLVFDAEAFRG